VDTVHLDAAYDMALTDERAFEDIDDLQMSTRVLEKLSRRLSASELLERISHSSFTAELLGQLPKVLGMTYQSLHPVMDALSDPSVYSGEWAEANFTEFSDCYWGVAIRDRINRNDPRRAWDETRKAVCFEPAHLALSREAAESYTAEIFDLIRSKEGSSPVLPKDHIQFTGASVPALPMLWRLYDFPEPDSFGRPLWGEYEAPRHVMEHQRKMMAIARHFAQKRLERKKQKAE
jgi:hypothetical protein